MKHISPRIVLATLGLMSVSVGFAVHAATRYTEMVDGDEITIRRPSDMEYDPFAMRPTEPRTDAKDKNNDAVKPPASSRPASGSGFIDPKQFIMPTQSGEHGIVRLPAVRPAVDRAPALTPQKKPAADATQVASRSDLTRLPAVRIPVTADEELGNQPVSLDVPVVRAGAPNAPSAPMSMADDDDIPIISASDAGPRPSVFGQNESPAPSRQTSPWSTGSERDAWTAPLTIASNDADDVGNAEVEAFPPVISPARKPSTQLNQQASRTQDSGVSNQSTLPVDASNAPQLPQQVATASQPNRQAASVQPSSPWQTEANPLVNLDVTATRRSGQQDWDATVQSLPATPPNADSPIPSMNHDPNLAYRQTGYGEADVQPVTQTQIEQPIVAYEPIDGGADAGQQEIVQFSEALQFQDSPSVRRGRSPLEALTQTSLAAEGDQQFPINTVSQDQVTPRIDAGAMVSPYGSPLSNLTQGATSIEDELMGDAFDPGSWGAPCPSGCPAKYYAKADFVAYQPEVSPFSLSSAISTDQSFFREGGRVTFGHRGDCLVGWEASALMLSNASEIISSTNQGITGPLGIRFVPESGFTNVNLTSFGAPNGLVHIQDHRQEFSTYEFNRMTWGWDVLNTMIGIRATHFQDDVRLGGGPTALPLENMPGLFRHNVENFLIGPQVGMTLIDDSRELLTFDFRGRLGGYVNLMEADTQFVNEGITYINRNNVQDVGFAASLDFTAGVALRITRNIHVRAGVDAMYYYGMATASEQLINSAVPGAVRLTPGTGSTIQNEDDLFYIGGTIGVYGNWP